MFRSSLRDGLIDYIDLLQRSALAGFRHEQTLYVAGGLKTAPAIPRILATDTDVANCSAGVEGNG